MEQGHSDLFTCVLSDLVSIFDLGCPENSQKCLFSRLILHCGWGGGLGGVPPLLECRRSRNEAGTTEPGRGEGGTGATGSKKLKNHKTEVNENVPKKVKIDRNLLWTKKMRAVKRFMEQGHSDMFTFVLSDLESIFDLGCPENSQQCLVSR